MANSIKFLTIGILLAVLVCDSDGQSTLKNASSILNWKPPKNWYQQFPYYISGFDYDGRPVVVLEFGKWDMRSKLVQGPETAEAMENYGNQFGQIMLYLGRAFEELGGITSIVDMDGLDYRILTHVPTLLLSIRVTAGFGFEFVNVLNQGIIINLNYAAERFINAMKPVLGAILDKCELLGTNKDRWGPKLRSFIPANQLPKWYTGSRKDWKPLQVLGQGKIPDIEMLRREQDKFLNTI